MLPEKRDSIGNTFLVTLVLCVGCSLLVSTAAVALKETQDENKVLDRQQKIIEVAGLGNASEALDAKTVKAKFTNGTIEPRVVDLQTGEYVQDEAIANESYDERKAARDANLSAPINPGKFPIGIARREKYTWVYLIKNEQGRLEQLVLPFYGKGLWSKMYGLVALDKDLRTINGLTFYEHGETPGLGGEVENAKWKQQWRGKKVWRGEPTDATLAVGVAKGSPLPENLAYMVDGLSGATITSRGVDHMLKYWFSSDAFGPYLNKLALQKDASDASTSQ